MIENIKNAARNTYGWINGQNPFVIGFATVVVMNAAWFAMWFAINKADPELVPTIQYRIAKQFERHQRIEYCEAIAGGMNMPARPCKAAVERNMAAQDADMR